MNTEDIGVFERVFKTFVEHYTKDNEYVLIVSSSHEGWKRKFPIKTNLPHMALVIKGWSKKETRLEPNGIRVVVAPKDEENSKLFLFEDILGITSVTGRMLLIKPYLTHKKKYSLKYLMRQKD